MVMDHGRNSDIKEIVLGVSNERHDRVILDICGMLFLYKNCEKSFFSSLSSLSE
jgi:hypothetical protein